MMKSLLASLLTLIVLHQALTAQAPPANDFAAMAKALGVGTKVEVQLVGGSHVRGRIAAVPPDALRLYVGRTNAGKVRTIAFTNIVALNRQPSAHGRILAWAAAGAILGAVVIAVSVLLIERRNESGLIRLFGNFGLANNPARTTAVRAPPVPYLAYASTKAEVLQRCP